MEETQSRLSGIFVILCIVDLFGVFPVITLPKSVLDCGFYGIFIVMSVCSTQIYTAILLGKCWLIAEEIDLSLDHKKRYPYTALAEITYGNKFSNIVSVLVNSAIFCGGIPNLIVASQNLQLLGLRISDHDINISFCYWIIILGLALCPILWLGSPKDMKLLCSFSVGIVGTVFILLTGCLIFNPPNDLSNDLTGERPLWELIFICYGIVAFQYDIHPSVLTIQVDMQNKSKLNSAIIIAFAVSLGMFLVIMVLVAAKVGTSSKPSILEIIPTSIPLHLIVFLVALQLCLTLAVSNSALFQHLEDCMDIPADFNQRRCILRTFLILLAILIAESVPRFDLVMSLIGGTLTAPLIFILPPMFYLKMLFLQRKHLKITKFSTYGSTNLTPEEKNLSWSTITEIIICTIIILISATCTVITTFVNASNYSNFTQPCALNVTNFLINL